jgi:hypothetical protein
LEDHESKEITISELIERYLSNPELCFKRGWSELESQDSRRSVLGPVFENVPVCTTRLTKNQNNHPEDSNNTLQYLKSAPSPRPAAYKTDKEDEDQHP